MNALHSMENVFYPPGGMAHITENLAHLFEEHMSGKTSIRINVASQPNSNPHLGTVTTILTAFAVSAHLSRYFGLPASVQFDQLENSPGERVLLNDQQYARSLQDTLRGDRPLADRYMASFKELLNFAARNSEVPYTIRSYDAFQREPLVRHTLIELLIRHDEFAPLFHPSEKRLHVRFPCPKCGLIDKQARSVRLEVLSDSRIVLTASCPTHGDHSVTVGPDTSDFVDMNTQLRHFLKGLLLMDEDVRQSSGSIMVHGSDWAGVWSLRIHAEGLLRLGYRRMTPRLFAPLILDWSGAKFSKSLYLRSNAYQYLPPEYLDFTAFMSTYGEQGLRKIWDEVKLWIAEPKRFFRNYTIDYIRVIMGDM